MKHWRDVATLGGAGAVVYGCYIITPALGWIVGGAFVLYLVRAVTIAR